jgi:hypothetical protein
MGTRWRAIDADSRRSGHNRGVTARKTSNAAALARAVRRLRKGGRLDESAEMLVTLADTGAALTDAVCADPDVATYARARVLQAHAAVLAQLIRSRSPVYHHGQPLDRG